MMPRAPGILLAALLALAAGCATTAGYDYSAYRAHPPRSILVLPPLNQSTAVEGTYSYLATVTQPLAELGYYVFPVAVVDQFLKENGMPTAGEMHQIPLAKAAETMGADAVLFVTLEQYGSKFQVFNSAVVVSASANLVDTRTGTLLWQGKGTAQQDSSGGNSNGLLGALVAAVVSQMLTSSTDAAHNVSRQANVNLFNASQRGLPYGPYSPKAGTAP